MSVVRIYSFGTIVYGDLTCLEKPRVRFAPSPTGLPHIGNIRPRPLQLVCLRVIMAANLSYELKIPTRHGWFLGLLKLCLKGCFGLNIDWDEGPVVGGNSGPYYQSERLHIYHDLAERLVSQGNAYRCYCSQKPPSQDTQEQRDRRVSASAECKCRDLSQEDIVKLSVDQENKRRPFCHAKRRCDKGEKT
ncbi:MAG: hypothetical protein CM1200mP22_16530 [Dehalococcoidia bacterium]|nr:MAG: hypothetical protein CM1200mP22_16530 [Dehalococcoidia bacterium]